MMPVKGDKPVLNLNSVVYATDFSLYSQNAGLYAAQMAAYFSAKLLIAHAFTLSQAALEVEIGDRKESQQRVDLKRLLSQEANRLGMDSVDEVQQFIGEKIQRAMDLQEIAEHCSTKLNQRLLLVGTGQSALNTTPSLQRLQARFAVRVPLSDADVES